MISIISLLSELTLLGTTGTINISSLTGRSAALFPNGTAPAKKDFWDQVVA